MEWLIVFVFILLNYGMSNMIVYAAGPFHIFEHFRNLMGKIHVQFAELFSCMICYPTWNGIMLSILSLILGIHFTPFTLIFDGHYPVITVLLDGCFGSGTSWLIHNIEEWFERGNQNIDNDEDVIEVHN